jgi:hypothetical protein
LALLNHVDELDLAGGRHVATVANVPLIAPQTLFEGRIRRLDMRLTKNIKLTNRVKL